MSAFFSRRYTDAEQDSSDSGSATQIGSPTTHGAVKDDQPEVDLLPSGVPFLGKRPTTACERINIYLLTVAFGFSMFLLFLTVTTASRNNTMLAALQPYAQDVANVTNKTWGYGGMPVVVKSEDKMGGHDHGKASPTQTAIDPENTTILYGNMWKSPHGDFPVTIFPTVSDPLDELRPNEVVTYERNFLVKKHVSTVILYNRRIAANISYRESHTLCGLQAFMPPYQSVVHNKTWLTSNSPLDVWLLDTPPDGPWWAGKDFIKNGNYTLRSNMTWNTKPERKQKLGTIHAWPGMNMFTEGSFECPKPSGRKGERIAVEYACTPGPTEESCYLSFDARMFYPILLFEVAF